jgi:predicted MFS family arabinose efflux permease
MIAMHADRTGQSSDRKWVLPFATTLFAMVALQMSSLGFAPLLPGIQKQFSMSYAQVGLFTGIYGLIGIALSVPAGLMAKRFGEKWVLIGGLVVLALGLGVLSRATDFRGALIGRGVWIAGYRFAFVCVLTALALTCPPSLRGRLMGIVGAMSSLASVIGAPFGSSIAQAWGWRIAILAFGCTALLAAAVVAIFYVNIPSAVPQSAAHVAPEDPKKTTSAFRLSAVWGLALVGGLIGMPSFSVTFFVPSAAKSVFRLDPISAAWIISSGYLAAIFVNLLVGYLVDKFNKWIVMGVLMAILVPTCFAVTIDNLFVFRISVALILAIGFTATNQLYGIAADVLRGRQSGNVMGVVSLGAGVCGYLGPQMLGALRDWTGGFVAGWYMMAGVAASTVCGIALLNRYGRAKQRLSEQIRAEASG